MGPIRAPKRSSPRIAERCARSTPDSNQRARSTPDSNQRARRTPDSSPDCNQHARSTTEPNQGESRPNQGTGEGSIPLPGSPAVDAAVPNTVTGRTFVPGPAGTGEGSIPFPGSPAVDFAVPNPVTGRTVVPGPAGTGEGSIPLPGSPAVHSTVPNSVTSRTVVPGPAGPGEGSIPRYRSPAVDSAVPNPVTGRTVVPGPAGTGEELLPLPGSPAVDSAVSNPVTGRTVVPGPAGTEERNDDVDDDPPGSRIVGNLKDLIGRTPLMALNKVTKDADAVANVWAKLELMGPTRSVKDRIAFSMIEGMEREKIITPGRTVLIQPSSGNAGVAVAMAAAVKGYRFIVVFTSFVGTWWRNAALAFGAEVHITDGALGLKGAFDKARELERTIQNSHFLRYFDYKGIPAAHFETTGPEIWNDAGHKVDFFIAGVGTGGTTTGAGHFLKKMNPSLKIVAVQPAEVIQVGHKHKIDGIGELSPAVLDVRIINIRAPCPSISAIECARAIALKEGLLVGISSGAAVSVALSIAKNPENAGKNIVVILPSSGERYLTAFLPPYPGGSGSGTVI